MADANEARAELAKIEAIAAERALTEWETSERTRLARIVRINELSRIARERALTGEEAAERARLRAEFLSVFRASFRQELDNTYVEYPDGKRVKLSEARKQGG